MHRYIKGARSERELMAMLEELGYSIMRSAGSGVNSVSPDIIAFRKGKGYAFECKAWEKSSISIPIDKYELLKKWEENTAMETYMAWRMNGKGWFFIRLHEMNRATVNYTVTIKDAERISRRFDIFNGSVPAIGAYGVLNG